MICFFASSAIWLRFRFLPLLPGIFISAGEIYISNAEIYISTVEIETLSYRNVFFNLISEEPFLQDKRNVCLLAEMTFIKKR